jgi:hypothetical protein
MRENLVKYGRSSFVLIIIFDLICYVPSLCLIEFGNQPFGISFVNRLQTKWTHLSKLSMEKRLLLC